MVNIQSIAIKMVKYAYLYLLSALIVVEEPLINSEKMVIADGKWHQKIFQSRSWR